MLQIFQKNNFKIRGGLVNGEPYFVAKDIATALGYSDTQVLTRRLDDDEKGMQELHTPGGVQKITVINESGLYSSILASQKEEARQFKKWVTSEVLPSIRKHGAYMTEDKLAEVLADPDKFLDLAIKLREERDRAIKEKAYIGNKREATSMATASTATRKAKKLEVMLDESQEWASIKRMEIKTGKHFEWRKLKKASKSMNIPPRKIFDANYGEVNSYHSSVWLAVYNIDLEAI